MMYVPSRMTQSQIIDLFVLGLIVQLSPSPELDLFCI